MSTAGSAPSNAPGNASSRRPRIVRWRAVGLLLLAGVLGALFYAFFLDRLIESSIEDGASDVLGTAVELDALRIHAAEPALEIGAIRIADPFDPMRNLLEVGRVRVALAPAPLLERKIVVRQLAVHELRFGTRRRKPARRVPPTGFAPRALRELQQWAAQYRHPLLSLTPIDTIRSIVLDPSQLVTIRAATALEAGADSLRAATESGIQSLAVEATLDSARALVNRLRGASPATLGLDGTRRAIADVKRTLDAVNTTKQRLDALGRSVRDGVALLGDGLRDLDAARRQDYAFARSLLKLPSLEGPEISAALFGQVSLDRVQQMLYWARLVRAYMPPGLLLREEPGPKRLRRAGTTVRFPREREYPRFAIQRGEMDLTIPDPQGRLARYVAQISDLSSAPALTGRPTRFAVRPAGQPSGAITLTATGELDHRTSLIHDRAEALVAGLPLPGFDLRLLPVRVDPGRGSSSIRVTLDGDRVDARWTLRSDRVRWLADTAELRTLNTAESLVYRVLAGLPSLDLTARATGPLRSPELSVSSNLDRAIGARLRAVAGEEVAKAEARAREAVDRIVAERTAPVRAKVTAVQAEVQRRIDTARQELDQERARLEAQLKALTGLPGLPRLPGTLNP